MSAVAHPLLAAFLRLDVQAAQAYWAAKTQRIHEVLAWDTPAMSEDARRELAASMTRELLAENQAILKLMEMMQWKPE